MVLFDPIIIVTVEAVLHPTTALPAVFYIVMFEAEGETTHERTSCTYHF